jgi:hypothetical protein
VNIVKRKKRQVVELTDRDAAYDVLEKEETIKVTFQFFSYLCTELKRRRSHFLICKKIQKGSAASKVIYDSYMTEFESEFPHT